MYVHFRLPGPSATNVQCQLCRLRASHAGWRLRPGGLHAEKWQGSEHDSLAAKWRHTVNQWGEGVIHTIMPSYDGGGQQMYQGWGDNGS